MFIAPLFLACDGLGPPLLVGTKLNLKNPKDALYGIGHAVHGIFDVFLAEGKTDLLKELLVQGVPVVGLLRD